MKRRRFKELLVDKRPDVCPSCGYSPVGVIIYDLPECNEELMRVVKAGRIIPGGSVIPRGDRPQWACRNCGCEFTLRREEDKDRGGG